MHLVLIGMAMEPTVGASTTGGGSGLLMVDAVLKALQKQKDLVHGQHLERKYSQLEVSEVKMKMNQMENQIEEGCQEDCCISESKRLEEQ